MSNEKPEQSTLYSPAQTKKIVLREVKRLRKQHRLDATYSNAALTRADRCTGESFKLSRLTDNQEAADTLLGLALDTQLYGILEALCQGRIKRPKTTRQAADRIIAANRQLLWLRSLPSTPKHQLAIEAICFLKTRHLDMMARGPHSEIAYACDWYMDDFLPPEERSRVMSGWRKHRSQLKAQKRNQKNAIKKQEEQLAREREEHRIKYGAPAGSKGTGHTPQGGSVWTTQGGAPGLGRRR